MVVEPENGWFQKYVKQIMTEIERIDKSVKDGIICSRGKMNKLKPSAVIGLISTFVVIIAMSSGGIYASYRAGVEERQETVEYMILAEADKYCKKEKVYEMDTKLNVLEEKTNNIEKTVIQLDDRSEKMYELIKDMERRDRNKNRNSGDD